MYRAFAFHVMTYHLAQSCLPTSLICWTVKTVPYSPSQRVRISLLRRLGHRDGPHMGMPASSVSHLGIFHRARCSAVED